MTTFGEKETEVPTTTLSGARACAGAHGGSLPALPFPVAAVSVVLGGAELLRVCSPGAEANAMLRSVATGATACGLAEAASFFAFPPRGAEGAGGRPSAAETDGLEGKDNVRVSSGGGVPLASGGAGGSLGNGRAAAFFLRYNNASCDLAAAARSRRNSNAFA